jgi:hypothetical protein
MTNDPLNETIAVFRSAGLEPEVKHGRKHIKTRTKKLGALGRKQSILAVVATTPSDGRAGVNARAVARRLVQSLKLGEPRARQPEKRSDLRSKARAARRRGRRILAVVAATPSDGHAGVNGQEHAVGKNRSARL